MYAWAAATVPSGLAYSGMLKNFGSAVSGAHRFDFDLVDGSGAGVGCATDTRLALAVTAGRFDVPDLFAGCSSLDTILGTQSSLFVRIAVDGTQLSPDQKLATVPFAARARAAENAAGPLDTRIASIEASVSGASTPPVVTLTSGSTISVNGQAGRVFAVTLGTNATLANPTNPVSGARYSFLVTQDASGFRTLAFGSAYKFPNGALAVAAGASKTSVLEFVSDGTNLHYASSAIPQTAIANFDVSGSWTPPAGVTQVTVEVWGGGGGGGGADNNSTCTTAPYNDFGGAGGAGGGYARGTFNVTPGTPYNVTVGAGGAPNAQSGNGGSGGTSSFGGVISATGGAGGLSRSSTSASGGIGSGGTFTESGQNGQGKLPNATGGAGGAAGGGGGAGGAADSCNTAGYNNGTAPGGGGAGAGNHATDWVGASGAAGRVRVTY